MIEEMINRLLEQEEENLHDFGDGNGPVPAHRHRNLDDTLGGWVANTAGVEATAYIGSHAEVFGEAIVWDGAVVSGQAKVFDEAHISYGARISDQAVVKGNAHVGDGARVEDRARVYGNAAVYGANVRIYGNAEVCGWAMVLGRAEIYDHAYVSGLAYIDGGSRISGQVEIKGQVSVHAAVISGNVKISGAGAVLIHDGAEVSGNVEIMTRRGDKIKIRGENTVIRSQEDLMKYLAWEELLSVIRPFQWEELARDLFFSEADRLGYEPTPSNFEDFADWLGMQKVEDIDPSDLEDFILKELEDWAGEGR